jgi:hypothetical protein
MRHVNRAALVSALVFGAFLSMGCGDKSTEPKDNPAPSAPMRHVWSDSYGAAAGQFTQGIAADDSGNVIVTGIFAGTFDFGGGNVLTSAGGDDIFVAKLGAAGADVWSKRFGDANQQNGFRVAVDGAGNVILAGFFSGTVNFGGSLLTSQGGSDVFVAKFGPGGAHVWSKSFGAAQEQYARSVVVDHTGNVFVTGYFYNTIDFGGGALTSAGSSDIFVAKLDPSGNHIWSKRFGNAGAQAGFAAAVDASGNVIVAGYLYGAIDFGGGNRVGGGNNDVFLAKFAPNGDHLWSECFGDASDQAAMAVAVDASDNVIVAGIFQGGIDFSGANPLTSAGLEDIFVAKLGSDGAYVWSERFGDVESQNPQSVAVDASGNVTVTGYFMGSVNFGGGALTAGASGDMFLAKFGPGGADIWSKSFGDGSGAVGRAVAVDPSGNVFVTGYFPNTINFGGGNLVSAGGYDIFLAKFAK